MTLPRYTITGSWCATKRWLLPLYGSHAFGRQRRRCNAIKSIHDDEVMSEQSTLSLSFDSGDRAPYRVSFALSMNDHTARRFRLNEFDFIVMNQYAPNVVENQTLLLRSMSYRYDDTGATNFVKGCKYHHWRWVIGYLVGQYVIIYIHGPPPPLVGYMSTVVISTKRW